MNDNNVPVNEGAARYFFFAAYFQIDQHDFRVVNYGLIRDSFPTKEQLHEEVKREHPNEHPRNIAILSICELSEEDYITFWRKEDTSAVPDAPLA